MCGRYYLPEDDLEGEELAGLVAELNRRQPGARVAAGEIAPGDTALALAGRGTPMALEWGFPLDGGRRVINARSETAGQRPMFAGCHRIALPARHYFEWDARRRRHALRPDGGKLFWLGGLYRPGPDVFAVLTMAPGPRAETIHDRMPVMLPGAALDRWLDPEVPLEALLPLAAGDAVPRLDAASGANQLDFFDLI